MTLAERRQVHCWLSTVNRKRRKPVKRAALRPEARAQHEILAPADKFGIGSDYRQIPESAKAQMYGKPCLPLLITLDSTARRRHRAYEELAPHAPSIASRN